MTADTADRYSRQIRFAPIGKDGQDRLARSRVAVVGCGALGTAIAEQLCRAGIGFLRLIDRDFVEWSNLQRQSLYVEADAALGRPKAVAAAEHVLLEELVGARARLAAHADDLVLAARQPHAERTEADYRNVTERYLGDWLDRPLREIGEDRRGVSRRRPAGFSP